MVPTRYQWQALEFRDRTWCRKAEIYLVNHLVDMAKDYDLHNTIVVLALCQSISALLTRDFHKNFNEAKLEVFQLCKIHLN